MRILYLNLDRGIPVLGGKGGAVHIRAMVAAMARAGHDVTLAATRLVRDGEAPQPVDAAVRLIPTTPAIDAAVTAIRAHEELTGTSSSTLNEIRRVMYNQVAFDLLADEFTTDPPALIYERLSLHGTAGHELAAAFGVPHLVEVNAPLSLEAGAYRRLQLADLARATERHVLTRADGVLAVSDPVRDHALALGVAARRAHVLHNGVDPMLFHPRPRDPDIRRVLGAGGGDVLIGFVGGLRPWHGVESLPALMERLIALGVPARLAVIGDGPLRDQLEADVTGAGVADRVTFTGALAHDQVARMTAQLDIALAPYPPLDHDFYFSPLKLFEYMGSGAAVIASRVGQIAEVVDDGRTGLLVPPGDLEALVNACHHLATERSLRERLAAAAAELVHERYTWDGNVARVVQIAERCRTAVSP